MNADLIERLEKAESGSRELDAAIWYALIEKWGGHPDRDMIGRWPPYTTSLDAIVALIGEKSPLRGPIDLVIAGSAQCTLNSSDPCGPQVQAYGLTAPLACCIALLRALEQGGAGG